MPNALSAEHLLGGTGGLHNGAREASFEAKASEDSLTGMGGRRYVLGDGGRRIGGSCPDCECTIARHRTTSRHYARRGGNIRRQLGDVLCLRQGNPRNARPTTGQGLRRLRRQVRWRLQGRRLRRQVRRRMRLQRMRLQMRGRLRLLLCRLRNRWLHLLLVVGSLPALLD
jgi:hypothetical protein